MRSFLILALAASLSACATLPAPTTAAIDRAQARYDQVKGYAELILPYLPAEHAARIRLAGRVAEAALRKAREAATMADRRAALAEAEAATTAIDTTSDL